MGRAAGFLGLLIALGVGAWLYTRQSQGTAGASATRSTVDLVAVNNHLLMLANAERGQLALDGKYATLDELMTKGSVPPGSDRRPPYSFAAEVNGAAGFRIVATYEGPAGTGAPRQVSIDETMRLKTE